MGLWGSTSVGRGYRDGCHCRMGKSLLFPKCCILSASKLPAPSDLCSYTAQHGECFDTAEQDGLPLLHMPSTQLKPLGLMLKHWD